MKGHPEETQDNHVDKVKLMWNYKES